MIAINRPSGGEPLHAVVTPSHGIISTVALGWPRASSSSWERDQRSPIDQEAVRCLYGLTDAEAAVVEGLVRGLTLGEIAAERRASIHTVRTQMKSVLSKTGAGRQRELVRRVLHGPAILVPQTLLGRALVTSSTFPLADQQRPARPQQGLDYIPQPKPRLALE